MSESRNISRSLARDRNGQACLPSSAALPTAPRMSRGMSRSGGVWSISGTNGSISRSCKRESPPSGVP